MAFFVTEVEAIVADVSGFEALLIESFWRFDIRNFKIEYDIV